ncbi:tetratricopeptide repeat protein [Acanthopleuribacter pedis]|uniref:Tetratricopeptide repeat protein n=1 Tax=Acanthopleuribacter pedis TaxID=442870 RepID=A0A8J7U509_9BACT|nr:tetratricopeptide repeat protein [Acanthopleuribacter pedis]MBO1321212.1 tetratricopeptide repeat protein [Acanthopleuribacter pedis]
MSENVEDLYLKGFMAFSAKNYAEAKSYWEKVLQVAPDHQEARKGLQDIMQASQAGSAGAGQKSSSGTKKRSSKEILQEIKRLYSAKQYQEARRLCEYLLKKHPNNNDLKGLFKKIDARFKATQSQSGQRAPSDKSSPDLESTMYYTSKAEAFVEGESAEAKDEDHTAAEVERLTQQGVQLYEVQDYDRALAAWRKALELDPSNRIVQDYVNNVSAMMAEEQAQAAESVPAAPATSASASSAPASSAPATSVPADPTPATSAPATSAPATSAPATSAPGGDKGGPSKEALLNAYNEGLQLYESGQYAAAMEKWHYILEFHPNHKETQQCLEKTKVAIEQQHQYKSDLENAKKALLGGDHEEAERLVKELTAKAPDLDGLSALKNSIENRKKQINEIRSLELEEDAAKTKAKSGPSDEEITKFFTPDADEGATETRQVTKIIKVRNEKKPINKLWFILPVVAAVLAGGGYFGFLYWERLQEQKLNEPEEEIIPTATQVDWNSDQQIVSDFMAFAEEYTISQKPAMAVLSYRRVREIATKRAAHLNEIAIAKRTFEDSEELKRLTKLTSEAQTNIAAEEAKLGQTAPPEDQEKTIRLAQTDIQKKRFQEAVDRLGPLLANNLDNIELQNLLGGAHESLAFEKLKEKALPEAVNHFRSAAVLKTAYVMPRRNMEVIERFFNGKISEQEKDQWFYFRL